MTKRGGKVRRSLPNLSFRTHPVAGIRWQLERLLYSPDVEYKKGQTTGKRTGCIPGTRTGVRDVAGTWYVDADGSPIFWLNGMAGTGKSTVADSFTTDLANAGFTVVSCFCSRDYPSARDVLRIFPSLAFQLAYKVEAYASALADALKKIPHPGNLDLEEQLTQLIIEPLKMIAHHLPGSQPFVCDAIDECDDRDLVRTFVSTLLAHGDDLRQVRVKFFIASRPAHEIYDEFATDASFIHHGHLILHDVRWQDAYDDIHTFIELKLQEIKRRYPHFDFQRSDVDLIAKAASLPSPLFIFASTVCAFIASKGSKARRDPQSQLESIRSALMAGDGSGHQATKALDLLYQFIFVSAFMADDEEKYDDEERAQQALTVVASIVLLSRPLGILDLSILLGDPYTPQKTRHLLVDLFSVITNPPDDIEPLRILHASLQDHMTSESRAHRLFCINPGSHHELLAIRCLDLMSKQLVNDNLFDLRPGKEYTAAEIQARRMACISDALEYACQFWSYHLVRTSPVSQESFLSRLQIFSSRHLLRWIEVLVTIESLYTAVPSIQKVRLWLAVGFFVSDLFNVS